MELSRRLGVRFAGDSAVGLRTQLLVRMPPWVLHSVGRRHYLSRVRRHVASDRAIIRALVNPGDTVLDLGAHVGWYTKALSELVGPYGRVVAVEPVPTTFEYLAYNVRKLGLRNVVPVAAAVSSHLGHGLIEVPAYEAGAAVAASRAGSENSYEARLITPTEPVNGQRRYAVPLTTIDHLAASDPVQFIKLDVEDHELAALEGAGATIRRDHPAFVIELLRNPDHHIGSPQAGIVQLLAGHGYQAFWWNGAALRACRRPPQHPSSDYFFVRSEHLERLRAAGCTPS